MKVIIYNNDEGILNVIYPIAEFVASHGIDAIAKKDVPAGKPYKIIDIRELPLDGTVNENGIPNLDKSFRDQWSISDEELLDGVGGVSHEFI